MLDAWKIMENHGKSWTSIFQSMASFTLCAEIYLREFPAVIAPRSGAKLSPAMAVKLTAG